ncbi:hypothetical protein F441_19315 [Phytophthora nicotianae CJ01A1]|uniref:Uncharacterized protein n=1 Tax=Phytophthora nicotianae CJ01A1 TaxID=1317063 RepID=W2W057_PHYNI|nr:hypothetical protein F441_19315 [Phytophthora nicotianae CJ01A1]
MPLYVFVSANRSTSLRLSYLLVHELQCRRPRNVRLSVARALLRCQPGSLVDHLRRRHRSIAISPTYSPYPLVVPVASGDVQADVAEGQNAVNQQEPAANGTDEPVSAVRTANVSDSESEDPVASDIDSNVAGCGGIVTATRTEAEASRPLTHGAKRRAEEARRRMEKDVALTAKET